MSASLFLKVPKDLYDAKVKDIYIRAITDTFGDIPYAVVNDGDVSALAGTMSLGDNNVLGIAMGTSEAVGYVDAEGRVTGWLNELAFVPVDAAPDAMRDEWSGDIGCGEVLLPGLGDQAGSPGGHRAGREPLPRRKAEGGPGSDGPG